MRVYAAPMEGITGYIFRNAHHAVFSGIDRYYMPFLSPGENRKLSAREKNDILPEHNAGLYAVPQILSNRAEYFLWMAELLAEYGYPEINLNLGCPSGTVTAKGKGAGFLADRDALDRFLEEVFDGIEKRFPGLALSIKTRLGYEREEEFAGLIPIFNRYPVSELILHPRVRNDFYQGTPRMEVFWQSLSLLRMPVCYNGNLFSLEDVQQFWKEASAYGKTEAVMLGRGLTAGPWISEEVKQGCAMEKREALDKLKAFHDRVLEGYAETMSGDRNVLFKMKELWFYLGNYFPASAKELKKVKKAQKLTEYSAAVDALFVPEAFEKEQRILI